MRAQRYNRVILRVHNWHNGRKYRQRLETHNITCILYIQYDRVRVEGKITFY